MILSMAACLVLTAWSTQTLANGPCRVFIPEKLRTPEIIRQAESVSAVLSDLSARRERFLATGGLIEMFPAIYFHTTQVQFREAVRNDPAVAEAMLGLIVTFYDAYLYNRYAFDNGGLKAVEPHWKRYYQRAAEEDRSKKTSTLTVFAISLYGVDAHLIDLARSVRFTIERMTASRDDLQRAYFKLDPVFFEVGKTAMEDLSATRKLEDRYVSIERRLGLGARYVITARKQSWNEAVANGPLRATAPQPVLPHMTGNRDFFTFNEKETCTKPK